MNLQSQVQNFFSATGPLAKRLANYSPREAQIKMAVAAAKAMDQDNGRLICEAGTGTGKSLAYLVPALLSERRVMVSTGTRALQDQLFYKDLPLVIDAIREMTGQQKTALMLKGRANYLCLYKLNEAPPIGDLLNPRYNGQLDQLRDWADETKTGEFSELSGIAEDSPILSELSAKAETCLGQDCSLYADCFVTNARRKALSADVLVVNHALLCADRTLRIKTGTGTSDSDQAFAQIIPDADIWIIDEAHALEDAATRHFGVSVAFRQIKMLSRDLQIQEDLIADREQSAYRLASAGLAEQFLATAEKLLSGFENRVRISSDSLVNIAAEKEQLFESLRQLRVSMMALKVGSQTEKAIMGALSRRVQKLHSELDFLLKANIAESGYVAYAERDGRGVVMHAAPIDVSHVLKKALWATESPIILTSATLAVQNDLAPFAARIGVEASDELEKLVVAAPFDYASKAGLYLPNLGCEPNHPNFANRFLEEARFLVELCQGGAFLLFTSFRFMDIAHQSLEGHFKKMGLQVFKQGEAPKMEILKSFIASDETGGGVLFATHSFWEGVDVRGQALRLVVIDRLPFQSPDDPIYQVRSERLKEKGLSPFMHLSLPDAALSLKQGAGRLLRTVEDSGIVAILDSRIRTARYGKVFLDTLPPMKRLLDRTSLTTFWSGIRPESAKLV